MKGVLAAPAARLLASQSHHHAEEVRRVVGELGQAVWLQTNHLEHLLRELDHRAWLNANHFNEELRAIRRSLAAPNEPSDSTGEMLAELLLQLQATAASAAAAESRVRSAIGALADRVAALEAARGASTATGLDADSHRSAS